MLQVLGIILTVVCEVIAIHLVIVTPSGHRYGPLIQTYGFLFLLGELNAAEIAAPLIELIEIPHSPSPPSVLLGVHLFAVPKAAR